MLESRKQVLILLRSQFVLALLIAVALVAGDFFFFGVQFQDRYPRPWTAWFETIGLIFLFSLALPRRPFFILTSLLALMAFVQMSHLAYFGTFIHPTKIYLFFKETGEVAETLMTLGSFMFLPVLIFLLTLSLIWVFSLLVKSSFVVWWPLKWIIAVALLYSPVRTFVNNNDYGRQPAIHNLAFSNTYGALSYFFGKTLPFKLSRKPVDEYRSNLKIARTKPKANVIFILGESLRYQNMEIFGYRRSTTPELKKLSLEMPMVMRKGISGGVSTDVAIPLFVNNYQNRNPMPAILSQEQCLFKLAKDNGFTTHFYSAQAEGDLKHILNYICPKSVDHLKIGLGKSLLEDIEKRFYDDQLLGDLEKIDFTKPNFVLFHQRGSHSPYELRYPKESAAFPINPEDSAADRIITHYDNSVAFTDQVVSKLIREVTARSPFPTYVVFTSDHGQILGENKAWGHIEVNEFVFKVPFVFVSSQKDSVFESVNKYPKFISHKDMSDLLIELMGYERPSSPETNRKVFVMGYDIDGLEGGVWVSLGEDEISSVEKSR